MVSFILLQYHTALNPSIISVLVFDDRALSFECTAVYSTVLRSELLAAPLHSLKRFLLLFLS